MFEYALMFVIFVGVMAVTALVFGIWVVVALVRAVFRGITAVVAPSTPALPSPPNAMPMGPRGIVCAQEKCKAVNVDTARFCRRCGTQLPQAERVTARRVAMW